MKWRLRNRRLDNANQSKEHLAPIDLATAKAEVISSPLNDITSYLSAVNDGTPGANEKLLEAVYDTLRRIAANRLSREIGNQTLHPTELVHEAWLRLGGNELVAWENRRHFFGAAAEAMRRTLIDNARHRKRAKRGGAASKQVLFSEHDSIETSLEVELLDLNEALESFELIEPLKAQVVKLKFFGGMTIDEIATVMTLSCATVERYWAYAKAWLYQRMSSGQMESDASQNP